MQVWPQVDESLDPAALGADRLPGHGIECLEDAATDVAKSLASVHFTLKSERFTLNLPSLRESRRRFPTRRKQPVAEWVERQSCEVGPPRLRHQPPRDAPSAGRCQSVPGFPNQEQCVLPRSACRYPRPEWCLEFEGTEGLAYRRLHSQLGVAANGHETLHPELAPDGVTDRRT